MKLTRRQILVLVWVLSVIGSGFLVGDATRDWEIGLATSLVVLGTSLGVPLMRAFTEFSK